MTFDEYQKLAVRTMAKDGDPNTNLAVLGLGVCGEAAELGDELLVLFALSFSKAGKIAEIVKKHVGHGKQLDIEKVKNEIGDYLWYPAVICETLGISLSECAELNIQKLRTRYPEGFSVEASEKRVDTCE